MQGSAKKAKQPSRPSAAKTSNPRPEELVPPTSRSQPVVNSPQPARPPPREPEPEDSVWGTQGLTTLGEEELLELLVKHGGQVPPVHLGAVCSRIEAFTKLTAPRVMGQKRVFITDWMEKNAPAVVSARPVTPEPQTPPPRSTTPAAAEESALAAGVPRPVVVESGNLSHHHRSFSNADTPQSSERSSQPSSATQRSSSTRKSGSTPPRGINADEFELGLDIASYQRQDGEDEGDEALAATAIPTQDVPVLCSRVVALLHQHKSPATLSARRCLLEDWYRGFLARVPVGSISRELDRRRAESSRDTGGDSAQDYVIAPSLTGLISMPVTRADPAPSAARNDDAGRAGHIEAATLATNKAETGRGTQGIGDAPRMPAIRSGGMDGATPPPSLNAVFLSLTSAPTADVAASEPVLHPAHVAAAVNAVSSATGVFPTSDSPAEQLAFLADWFRWERRVRGGNADPDDCSASSPIGTAPASSNGLRRGRADAREAAKVGSPQVAGVGGNAAASAASRRPSTARSHTNSPLSSGAASPNIPARASASPGNLRPNTPTVASSLGAPEYTRRPATAQAAILRPDPLSSTLGNGKEPSADALMEALRPYTAALLSTATPPPGVPTLSSRDLILAAHQVERFCGKRVPSLPQQKREYIASWIRATNMRKEEEQAANGGMLTSKPMRAPRMDRGMLQEGEAAMERAMAQLAATLAKYARVGDAIAEAEGAGTGSTLLDVPNDHLALLCEQVENVTGEKAPRQQSARRSYLDRAWLESRRKRA